MMATSGKLEDWFGIRLFRAPNVAGRIAFVSDRNGHSDIWVMNSDGSGQTALTNDDFDDISPVWSPDGTEIVFVSNRDDGRYQLYAVPYKGGRIRKLSQSSGTKSCPVFSPDSKEIAFVNAGKISVREVDGRHEHQVLPSEEQTKIAAFQEQNISYGQVDWASSRTWLAAVRRLDPGEVIDLLNMQTGESGTANDDQNRPLAGKKAEIAWSTSGQRLATVVVGGAEGNSVAVVDIDRETFIPLLKAADPKYAAIQPAWSPDDSQLVMVSALVDKDNDITPVGLIVTDTSSGQTEEVEKGQCENPKWSKDGKQIAYTKSANGKRDIWILNMDNGKTKNLTGEKGNNFSPCWAPGVPK